MSNKNTTHTEDESFALDLTSLAGFQFGPAWAKPNAKGDSGMSTRQPRDDKKPFRGERRDERRGERTNDRRDHKSGGRFRDGYPSGEKREFRQDGRRDDRRGGRDDRRDGRRDGRDNDRRDGGFARRDRPPLPEPTEGVRVEVRPVNAVMLTLASEIQKHKRTVSLFDVAKAIANGKERYDLVFMKQEDGPSFIVPKTESFCCFLTRQEALQSIHRATWLPKYYALEVEEQGVPKGDFKSVAKCTISGDIIGPANWHGYQLAIVQLHKNKFANMPFDVFRSKISSDATPEAMEAWVNEVSKRQVWKPKREGADSEVIADAKALEKDFEECHFDDVFEVVDKVFVNGGVKKYQVSPGIWAHLVKISNVIAKHASMLIPNLCHGLARHHMPIFKWQGGHFTGPTRPKPLEEGVALSDRIARILTWIENNPTKKTDEMLRELGGELPAEGAEGYDAIYEIHQGYIKDVLWLCDQGYALVFMNRTLGVPKKVAQADAKADAKADARAKPAEVPQKKKKAKKNEPRIHTRIVKEVEPAVEPVVEPAVEPAVEPVESNE